MKPKEIKCLDPVMKYCQECPYGIVVYGSAVETYVDTYGACYETSCIHGLEDTEPTKKELEEFEKWYRKQEKGERMSNNDTYINFIRNKEAQRKDKDNIFCTGISDTEFVKFAIKYLLGNDWYVVDPLGHNQVTQLALEDILFKYSKQFKKEYKKWKLKKKEGK